MTLSLSYAFTITADLAEPRVVGLTPAGHRRVIAITGGQVDGPALTGEVLPGGADWSVVRPDGAVHVWARYRDPLGGRRHHLSRQRRTRQAGQPAGLAGRWAGPGRSRPGPSSRSRATSSAGSTPGSSSASSGQAGPGRVTIAVHEVVPA